MHYSKVKIKEVKTISDCYETIDLINMTPENIVGGHKAFFSGYVTELKLGAKKKIEQLNNKAERIYEKIEEK